MNLIDMLRRCGVEDIPRLADFERLNALTGPRRPDWPASVLDMTDNEIMAVISAMTAHDLVADLEKKQQLVGDIKTNWELLRLRAGDEFTASLRENAEYFIVQMQPRFTQAADAARALRSAGIMPEFGAEQILDFPLKVQQVWRAFRTGHSEHLDLVLTTRMMMSKAWDLPPRATRFQDWAARPGINGAQLPANNRADFTLTVCNSTRLGTVAPRPGEPKQARWLRLAEVLELRPFAIWDDLSEAAAVGVDTTALIAEAQRRCEASDDDDEPPARTFKYAPARPL